MRAQLEAVLSGEARWCVLHADNAEVLPLLGDKSVAHVVTDPPYEAEAHTLQRRQKKTSGKQDGGAFENADGRIVALAPLGFEPLSETERVAVGAEIARLTRRWVAIFCQVEASQRWAASLSSGGARYVRTGVWIKPDASPQFSGDRPGMGYESIVFAHAKGRTRWNGGGHVAVYSHNKSPTDGPAPHPTTKPVPLMLELVGLFTDADDVVLDPFCGSGTTGVACLRLGRRFIGVEKDAKYAAVARERLQAEAQGLTLRDARAGQQPLFPGGGA